VKKFISWNVNGIRACVTKGFLEAFAELDADIFCLQETKLQAGQIDMPLEGYYQYWNYAEKKGYSGTAIFTKEEPIAVKYGMGIEEHDTEGRLITLEFSDFFFVTCYTPNAQDGLKRIDYRMSWEDAFREYLLELDKSKPVIVCGDLNVAHNEIDLKNPKSNRGNAGFSLRHDGQTYFFQSQEAMLKFQNAPEFYALVFNGMDIVLMADQNKTEPGSRKFGLRYKDRNYVFKSQENREAFKNNPDYFISQLKQNVAASRQTHIH